jgi:predicted enzyme related to lactoylglutathione lyase
MPIHARFVHANIVAQDWKVLARFYETVFGCIRIPPERHLTESWVERATGVEHAEIHGIHLRLPGYGDYGPTLEIFSYYPQYARSTKLINHPGLAHLAFAVDDVDAARYAVLDAGGEIVGERTTVEIPNAGIITFQYLSDPEGNIIEVQKWTHAYEI